MTEKINLKELQRKAWRSTFEDGLWDIFMGLLLLNIAVYKMGDEIFGNDDLKLALLIVDGIFAMLFLWAGKHFITVPRLGNANFGRYGKVRRSKAKLFSFVSVLIGLVVFLIAAGFSNAGEIAGIPRVYVVAVGWVMNAILVFGLAGYFLDFNRLYVIGALFALSFPLEIITRELWNTDRLALFAYAGPAIIILAVGLFSFTRFLKKYPANKEDA